jgi:hypothetical protein
MIIKESAFNAQLGVRVAKAKHRVQLAEMDIFPIKVLVVQDVSMANILITGIAYHVIQLATLALMIPLA